MLILTKIHEQRFIEDMYENEYLYFNCLKEFRGSKIDNSGRKDPRELNLKTEQLKTLTVSVEEKEIPFHKIFKDFKGQYNEHLSDPKINCCSLHWLEIEPGHPPSTINNELISMGNKTLLIYDWKKFFEILDNSIENSGFEYSRRKVTYYNPRTFNGDLTLHHKDEELSWQNEYRVLIAPVSNEQPININLTGLKEISCVVDTTDLMKLRIEVEK